VTSHLVNISRETEKNLDAVFSARRGASTSLSPRQHADDRRTTCRTSNDRYPTSRPISCSNARVVRGHFSVVPTTNTGDRIDPAFRRRLDVVVEFRSADATERWSIWHLHLPPDHAADDAFLDEVAARWPAHRRAVRNCGAARVAAWRSRTAA